MPRTVLITGCSKGGLGDHLAQAFHARGLTVFATARSLDKMAHLRELGVHTLPLDVLSAESIAACAAAVGAETGGSLDLLVNNAGHGYSMPLLDVELGPARRVFDTNVWGVLLVVQAFTPLLLKSTAAPTVVNNTSVASVSAVPTGGVYGMSKAAASMLTDTLRVELLPFSIRVVELRTGTVRTSFFSHQAGTGPDVGSMPTLPPGSLYNVARAEVEHVMAGSDFFDPSQSQSADQWARNVVADLLRRPDNPPFRIWRGGFASIMRLFYLLPLSWTMSYILKVGAMDVVGRNWAKKAK